jgi:chemotaxis protein histidine kinase CheA
MSFSREELLRRIDDERKAYRATLPQKAASIDEWLTRAASEPASVRDLLAAIERAAHSMHGTAGTFGMAGISRAAAGLEDAAVAALAEEGLACAASLGRVSQAAGALQLAVRAAVG